MATDADVAKRFAENLAHYRDKSGLSQEALASRAEIHRSQASELLRGRQVPRITTVARLAGALGCTAADLLEGIVFEPAEATGQFKIASRPQKK